MVGSHIDLGNPVADHPLNAGLVAWWLPLPNNSGGYQLHDLKGKFTGALTGFGAAGAATSGWADGDGGLRSIRFDGSDDHILGSAALTTATDNLYVEVACRPATLPQSGHLISVGDGGGSANGFGVGIHGTSFGNSGSRLTLLLPGVAWRNFSYSFPAANEWYHVVVGRAAGTWRAWVNGTLDATTFSDSIGAPASLWAVGSRRWSGGIGNYFGGHVSHARLATVAPTTDLAFGLYDQARRGHPNTLRRWTSRAWVTGGTAGTSNADATGSATVAFTPTATGAPLATAAGSAALAFAPATAGASFAAAAGSAAATFTSAAAGSALATTAGTAVSTLAPTAAGSSAAAGAGSAPLAFSPAGTGATLADATGTATLATTAAGDGGSLATGAGAAGLTFAPAATGGSLAAGAGAAATTYTLTAVGASLSDATGAAGLAFDATAVGAAAGSVGASAVVFGGSGVGSSAVFAAGAAALTFATTAAGDDGSIGARASATLAARPLAAGSLTTAPAAGAALTTTARAVGTLGGD